MKYVTLPRPTLCLYNRINAYRRLTNVQKFWLEHNLEEKMSRLAINKSRMELAVKRMRHLNRVSNKQQKFIMQADRLYSKITEQRKSLLKRDAALSLLRKDYKPITLDFLLGNEKGTIRY